MILCLLCCLHCCLVCIYQPLCNISCCFVSMHRAAFRSGRYGQHGLILSKRNGHKSTILTLSVQDKGFPQSLQQLRITFQLGIFPQRAYPSIKVQKSQKKIQRYKTSCLTTLYSDYDKDFFFVVVFVNKSLLCQSGTHHCVVVGVQL